MENWYAVKKNIANGTLGPCLSIGLARAQEKDEGLTDEEAAYTVGNIFEGGMETTSSTLYAFIQAMLLFPTFKQKLKKRSTASSVLNVHQSWPMQSICHMLDDVSKSLSAGSPSDLWAPYLMLAPAMMSTWATRSPRVRPSS